MSKFAKFAAALLALVAGTELSSAQTQLLTLENFSGYVGTLPMTSTFGSADKIYILQGGVSKALQIGNNPVFGAGITLGVTGVQAGQVVLAGGTLGNITLLAPPSVTTYATMLPVGIGLPGQALIGSGSGVVPSTWNTVRLSGRNIAARFGSMDVWQRGAGAAASIAVPASTVGAYTVDGCYLATGVNQAFTVASVAGIATGSLRAAAITRNSAQIGTADVVFGCPLDSDEIALLRGNFITLSFTLSTGANFSGTSVQALLICGTGAPIKWVSVFTGQTIPIGIQPSLGTNSPATRYQGTSAAVIPANCAQAEVRFDYIPVGTAGAADTFTVDDVQLEVAPATTSVASLYDQRTFEEQLHLAQRHYAKTFFYGTATAQAVGTNSGELDSIAGVAAAGTDRIWWRPSRSMRVNPAVTTFNPASANANCRDASAAADGGTTTVTNATAESILISCLGAAGTVVGNLIVIHATADSGI
jgi:hypothetical protein